LSAPLFSVPMATKKWGMIVLLAYQERTDVELIVT
jgi:hypothetical protein